jgi:hypothetical protein
MELYNNGTMLNLLWLVSVGSQSNHMHCATILKQCMNFFLVRPILVIENFGWSIDDRKFDD